MCPPVPSPASTQCPKYLHASTQAFGYGIQETRFIFRSQNLPCAINFTPGMGSTLYNDVVGSSMGPVNFETSKMDYVLALYETLFKIYLSSQFILLDVPFLTKFDRVDFSGDLITSLSMLKTQFVDQDVPLLPAGGYSNPVAYLLPLLERMFDPEDHRMIIGELSRATIR